jgi:hypothetical protein
MAIAWCPGRQRFEDMMERRRREETDPEALKALRRAWWVGSAAGVLFGSAPSADSTSNQVLASAPSDAA